MIERIKLILIDIDDCLLPTDGNFYPEYFAGLPEIAHYVEKANRGKIPQIGFCTERDRNYVEATAFSVGRPNSWSVIESGIALFNPTTKEMLINESLSLEVRTAFETLRRERLPHILEKFPDLFEYPGNMINIALERKYGVNLPVEEYYKAARIKLSDLERQDLITIHPSRIAIDISPPGIDKASGIRFLAKTTGISPNQMLGIGDSKGDFPMLNLVGLVGCPSNALEECKELIQKKGGYISPHQYARGVADVLRYYLNEG